jgi:DNA mismatch repair protein MutL
MMPGGNTSIRLLPDEVIRRIAAGEVIERPASVVKELVENALDAGATHVLVELKTSRGGIGSIAVTDDGCGIPAGELRLAVMPHATSKIRDDGDLYAVRSLGFRGEALASIGEAGSLTLTSRSRGQPFGAVLSIRDGLISGPREAGAPPGTRAEVEDLFASMPARRKFLRSVATELGRVYGVVESAALSRPGTRFTLLVNGRERLSVPGDGDLVSTLMALSGTSDPGGFFPVCPADDRIRVSGALALPGTCRQDPYRLFVILNGRPVRSPRIQQAVRDAYRDLLPHGSWPVGCIMIDLDPSHVDVNVHPAKLLVRFEREDLVADAVRCSVEGSLARTDLVTTPVISGRVREPNTCEGLYLAEKTRPGDRWQVREPSPSVLRDTERRLRQSELIPGQDTEQEAPDVIAQVNDLFLVAAGRDGALWIVDQHAAHERVLYEQVLARNVASGQELIVPVPLVLSPLETQSIEEYLPDLERAGFTIEPFGAGSYAVRSVPAVLGQTSSPAEVQDILSSVLGDDPSPKKPFRERVAQVVACRAAVKAGAFCTVEQGNRLLQQLFRCAHPYTCPHGRPTVVRFTALDLDRMFRRT